MDVEKIVAYDRSARKWIYHSSNGEIHEFPSGPAGKLEANLMRLNDESPKVADMLIHLETTNTEPGSLRRAFDGAMILVNDLILQPADYDPDITLARIASKSTPVEYEIWLHEEPQFLYGCTCPDWHRGYDLWLIPEINPSMQELPQGAPRIPGVGFMCKHTWAYHFSMLIKHKMSAFNPLAEPMAKKLWDLIIPSFEADPDLEELIETCHPATMNRGHFSLAIPDSLIESVNSQPRLLKAMNYLVDEKSHFSQVLVIL